MYSANFSHIASAIFHANDIWMSGQFSNTFRVQIDRSIGRHTV